MKKNEEFKLKEKKPENGLSEIIKDDLQKYSKIIKSKSKDTYENVKEKIKNIHSKTKPFMIDNYNKIKPKIIEIKKNTMPFLKKIHKEVKPRTIKIWETLKELSLIFVMGLFLFYSRIKRKWSGSNTNKININTIFTKKIIILIVIFVIFLYLFSMPLYYRFFYGSEEVKLLQPRTTRFRYPKSTTLECPEGKICESLFSKTSNFFERKCPISCDDDDKCTKDYCDESTNYQCVNELISGCKS